VSHRFFFGPERTPFALDQGMVEPSSAMPFHGIISRGLLNNFIANDWSIQLWYYYSPYLGIHEIARANLPDEVQKIQNLVQKCEVLSFGQSAWCAKIYVENYCQGNGVGNAQVDYWNIKEGHTSSVWKVTIAAKNTEETFIVNVARDREAGIELNKSSLKLKTIAQQVPQLNMAQINDIQIIQNRILPGEVVVTRNEWVENAYEIHTRVNKQTGKEDLLMVERFLTDQNNPANIISVVGRVFSNEETQKIEDDLDNFLTQAETCTSDKTEVNIDDGDVVWNGEKAIVVAIS
jgi:hypothetical protein